MINKGQIMVAKRFQIYGLIISCVLFLISCNNKENNFYKRIKNNDIMMAYTIKTNNENSIVIVMSKSKIIYIFKKYNQPINDSIIINNIKSKTTIEIPKKMYQELYSFQVVKQQRVDSLFDIGIEKFFFKNHKNERLLNPNALKNETSMEELYIIKVLFDQKILVQQDCESGYYYEVH